MQIEHKAWLPKNTEGVQGQKIAIVGYSHYVDDGPDRDAFTSDLVQCLVNGDYNLRFFTAIQGYFRFTDAADFWNRVIFFNFLPDMVGTKDDMYAKGTAEQLHRAQDRVLRIMKEERPEKIFVFTTKGWRGFPETTLEEQSGGVCTPLLSGRKDPNWGTYLAGDHRVLVCGFRHPQGADADDMRQQVKAFLDLRP